MTDQATLETRPESMPARPGEVRTLADFVNLGRYLIQNRLIPEAIDTPEKAAIIMLKGQEIGLRPMQALAHIFVIKGLAGTDTAVLEKLYTQAGHSYSIIEHTDDIVRGIFKLRNGQTHDHTLTMAEVEQYRWNQSYKSGKWEVKYNWQTMQKLMLGYRWLTTGIRKFAKGVELDILTRDELADLPLAQAEGEVVNGSVSEVVNGVVQELVTAKTAPESETEEAPQQENILAEHWAEDASNRRTLIAKMNQRVLTNKEALEALSEDCGKTIGRVREYPKSLEAALQALENYVDLKSGTGTQGRLF